MLMINEVMERKNYLCISMRDSTKELPVISKKMFFMGKLPILGMIKGIKREYK